MFEQILLAVDGSEHSKKATAAAADIGKKSGGEVHVLYIHEVGSFGPCRVHHRGEGSGG